MAKGKRKIDDTMIWFIERLFEVAKVEFDKVEEQNEKRAEEGGASKDGFKDMNEDDIQDVS